MLKPTDLSAVKSDGLAEILAIAVFQAANERHTAGDPTAAAVTRAMVKHAHELLGLHDIKADEVLVAGGPDAEGFYPPAEKFEG